MTVGRDHAGLGKNSRGPGVHGVHGRIEAQNPFRAEAASGVEWPTPALCRLLALEPVGLGRPVRRMSHGRALRSVTQGCGSLAVRGIGAADADSREGGKT